MKVHHTTALIGFRICATVFPVIIFLNASGQTSDQLYQAVQNLYISSQNMSGNCDAVRNVIQSLEGYRGYSQIVPANFQYTVRFPSQISNPTIGQLATDRQLRIKMQYEECFSVSNPRSDQLYKEVQSIYENYSMASGDCNVVKAVFSDLERYRGTTDPVPSHVAYSVSYRGQVQNPTIADLALDRQERIKDQFKNCFTLALSPDLLAILPGTWTFNVEGVDYQLYISNSSGTLLAIFQKQGYSYPPEYMGYEAITNNGIKLKFRLAGGTYQLSYDLWRSGNQLSGYVLESWVGVQKPVTMQSNIYYQPSPTVQATQANLTNGFTGQYYADLNSYWNGGYATVTRRDEVIDFDWGSNSPHSVIPADNFMVVWKADLVAPASGMYTLVAIADDGVQVSVNGSMLIYAWQDQSPTQYEANVNMEAGTSYQLVALYYERGGGAMMRLFIKGPGMELRLLR